MQSCPECKRCTELWIKSVFSFPFRLIWKILTFWNIDLFIRKCKRCGHPMSKHLGIIPGELSVCSQCAGKGGTFTNIYGALSEVSGVGNKKTMCPACHGTGWTVMVK